MTDTSNKTQQLVVTLTEKNKAQLQRIFANITVDVDTGCWIWHGARDQNGYGLTAYGGRTERVHRLLYALHNGPIPRGIAARRAAQLDHICKNRSCCNPAHLELVTQRTNTLRSNGITAQQASQTHCKRGHLLPPPDPNCKHRTCKICKALNDKKRIHGAQRERWLAKHRKAAKRYYQKQTKNK